MEGARCTDAERDEPSHLGALCVMHGGDGDRAIMWRVALALELAWRFKIH